MAIADDGGNSGQAGEGFRFALGVATGNDDARIGVEAMGAANESARGTVGLGRYAAGVDDDHIGGCGLLLVQACHAQAVADCFSVGARGAATEVLDMEPTGHLFSLRAMESARGIGLAGGRKNGLRYTGA